MKWYWKLIFGYVAIGLTILFPGFVIGVILTIWVCKFQVKEAFGEFILIPSEKKYNKKEVEK